MESEKLLLITIWLLVGIAGAAIGVILPNVFQYCWGVLIGSICSAILMIIYDH